MNSPDQQHFHARRYVHILPSLVRCHGYAIRSGELTLTPLELIDRIAALIPPQRTHRHRYYGALAPNSPLRAAVTALAQAAHPADPGLHRGGI